MAKKTVRCPWCGREVGLTPKKGLAPHVDPAGKTCVGSGMVPHPDHLDRGAPSLPKQPKKG
jgi:hypothetical protein